MALKSLFESKDAGLKALKQALLVTKSKGQVSALLKAVAAWPCLEVLGFDIGFEFVERVGIERVKVLVKHKDALLKKKWDKTSSLVIAEAVRDGIPYKENYREADHDKEMSDPVNSHHSLIFDLRDLIVDNNLHFMSWYYVLMLEHNHQYVRGCALVALHSMKAVQHLPEVAKRLQDEHSMNRRHAVQMIVENNAEEYAPKVRALLLHESEESRRLAAIAVDALNDKAALPLLMGAAARTEESERGVFLQSIKSLEAIKGTRKNISFIASYGGDNCVADIAQLRVIESVRGWRATWKKINPKAKIPEFDPQKNVALVAFLGQSVNTYKVSALSLKCDDEKMTIRLKKNSYQTIGGWNRVKPWGLFVFPRKAKRLLVDFDVNRYTYAPSKWKRLKTFKLKH